jgi:hypothetical protein
MRFIISRLLVGIIFFSACTKSSNQVHLSNGQPTGGWQLVREDWYLVANAGVRIPAFDSSVVLTLNPDSSYSTQLTGKTISQGSYSISIDSAFNGVQKTLQLNEFKTTGIFSLFTLYEFGANGRLISTFDGFNMYLSNDTMLLASPMTPGAGETYIFLKR